MKLLREKTAQHTQLLEAQRRASITLTNGIVVMPSLHNLGKEADDPQNVCFSAEQQVMLQIFFLSYVRRVDPTCKDLMGLGTWFRFLIDCNLLDPKKVTFSRGTSVFGMFAEKHGARQKLNFKNWCLAVERILQSPYENKSPQEIHALLFGDLLKLCYERVDLPVVNKSRPRRDSLSAADPRWLTNLVEDELCEPEVLQMLQRMQGPLYRLFQHFAGPNGSSVNGSCPTRKIGTLSKPRKDTKRFGEGMHRRGPLMPFDDRLDHAGFEMALQVLGIFPALISWHQMRKSYYDIVDRGGPDAIGFTGFVEGLCRAIFEYLAGQGNNEQKEASGKWKGLWMLCWLRDWYLKLGLGPMDDWDKRQKVKLDECPLQDLILGELLRWGWLRRKGHPKVSTKASQVAARPVSAGSMRLLEEMRSWTTDAQVSKARDIVGSSVEDDILDYCREGPRPTAVGQSIQQFLNALPPVHLQAEPYPDDSD